MTEYTRWEPDVSKYHKSAPRVTTRRYEIMTEHTDKERLDWLEVNKITTSEVGGTWSLWNYKTEPTVPEQSLREAIDKAMNKD